MASNVRRRSGRILRWALVVYLALLVASHAFRALTPEAPGEGGSLSVTTPLFSAEGRADAEGRARIAYSEAAPERGAKGLPLLLLHGSPGSGEDFDALAADLAAGGRRVIAPDMPGFGRSTRSVPDYSIAAQARYARALLDELKVASVHVVGFSLGGGAAVELASLAPERVASLTLLSATGVQELELLGDARLNHGLHAAQLAALWLLRELTPHFGALDGASFGVPYARSFFDTDQRGLRGLLLAIEQPTLILHGEADFLVPVEAAREHARIVPQAELLVFGEPAGHFLVFTDAEALAEPLLDFVTRVEAGEAPRREDAHPARLAEAAKPFSTLSLPEARGPALLILLVGLFVATLISEDLACIAGGLLAAQGRLDFLTATLTCYAGILFGDLGLYALGRLVGHAALRRWPLRLMVSPGQVERACHWFERRGLAIIIFSRFMPGTRLPTYLSAGIVGVRFSLFALYFCVASALWTPGLVALTMLVGEPVMDFLGRFERLGPLVALVLVLVLMLVLRIAIPAFTWRGRRGLLGSWRRSTRWEFWPPLVVYLPVVAWALLLGLRHRGLLLFTAANPAMPAGGLIGESKGAILAALAAGPRPELVARTERLAGEQSPAQRLAALRAFLARCALDYPLVLKPDLGQRGEGVTICESEEEAQRWLAAHPEAALVQEYVPGIELGVFWARPPGARRGRVISVTHKVLPELVGDGERTLEELIYADERAVVLASHYLDVNAQRAHVVPGAGERVRLVEIGTHARGAVFLEGDALLSPELAEAIEELSSGYEGFRFGRYDLRAPDLDALGRGAFRVLELNGVGAEATHVYDPKVGALRGWKTLFEQWRLAYEIGAEERARGARPATFAELLALWRAYRADRRLAREAGALLAEQEAGPLVGGARRDRARAHELT